ncbi:hypothetical protein [Lysobacter sp. TAB13]|uniref:hypothetical protein n=1 Tax=Lysobacter sp. TAB13 TaxID=3233065 RepID=UPI003F9AC149
MKLLEPFRHPAVVVMHLPGDFTRVRLFTLAHGEGWWEIPTESIPHHLRNLGSKLLVTVSRFSVEEDDLIVDIRNQVHSVLVEALPVSEGQGE